MRGYDNPTKNGQFNLRYKSNCWYSPEDVLFEFNNKNTVTDGDNFESSLYSFLYTNSIYDLYD